MKINMYVAGKVTVWYFPILYLICRLKSTHNTGHDDNEISANETKNKIQQIIAERGKIQNNGEIVIKIDTSNTQIHACPRYL